MHHVTLDDMDSRMGPADLTLPLTDALGATNLALNYYELDPGESFAYGLHAHESQEEVFYVVAGTVTFRTDDGDVEVGAGELVRFGPGEFQRGVNEGDDRVRALALGAPQDAGDTEILRECEACGGLRRMELSLTDEKDAVRVLCIECGSEVAHYT
jgi:uncharacterized cupin superfamily protein